MEQRIIINLGQGSWQQGFPSVIVQLWDIGQSHSTQLMGRLPAATELANLYRRWQSLYKALNSSLGLRQTLLNPSIEIEDDDDDITRVSKSDFEDLCQNLRNQFNAWLSVSSFVNVERVLRTHLHVSNQIQVIIQTEDAAVRQFPWHLWQFFSDYPQAEVAIGNLEHRKVSQKVKPAHSQIRILSILGDSTGIHVAKDRELITQLDAEVLILDERSRREVNDHLWNEAGWDVLFFAGHSTTQAGGDRGKIQINPVEEISIAELKYALTKAIQHGLQLAIFNSCDGMGLARELNDLDIPYLIVMREPVPDQVAQTFLMNFLRAFSTGVPIYLAVREARERLQGLENQFPCASWLPIICQNPSAISIAWRLLQGPENKLTFQKNEQALAHQKSFKENIFRGFFNRHPFRTAAIGSILITLLIIGIRALSLFQPLELAAYDHMMRSRPNNEGPDDRIAIITVSQADIEYQRDQGFEGGEASLKDEALLAVLQKLEAAEATAVGLDILHDFPFIPQVNGYLSQNSNFFAICRIVSTFSHLDSVSSPDSLPTEQIGFANFPLDYDGKIRRQLLGMTPDEICQTDESLSFKLAMQYLRNHREVVSEKFDIEPERLSSNTLRIGNAFFWKLNRNSGGFNLDKGDDGGYQVLANYRKLPPRSLSLRSLLTLRNDRVKSEFKNKIVLIGGLDGKDLHPTPYDRKIISKTPGVEIHAQMVSHLISVILDGRSQINWWPQWIENVWLLAWTLSGGILTILLRLRFAKSLWFTIVSFLICQVILYGICLLFFTWGVWVPWVPSSLGLLISSLAILIYIEIKPKIQFTSISAKKS